MDEILSILKEIIEQWKDFNKDHEPCYIVKSKRIVEYIDRLSNIKLLSKIQR